HGRVHAVEFVFELVATCQDALELTRPEGHLRRRASSSAPLALSATRCLLLEPALGPLFLDGASEQILLVRWVEPNDRTEMRNTESFDVQEVGQTQRHLVDRCRAPQGRHLERNPGVSG